jgi:hypothetical protein
MKVLVILAVLASLSALYAAVDFSQKVRAQREARQVVLECKAEQYDVYQRLAGMKLIEWEAACVRSTPANTSLDKLQKQCFLELKPCQ